jgi:hypothetical protein
MNNIPVFSSRNFSGVEDRETYKLKFADVQAGRMQRPNGFLKKLKKQFVK